MTEKEKYVLSHYRVTEDGRIFSCLSSRTNYDEYELKLYLNQDGYLAVTLVYNDSGNRSPFLVHRLVAMKYIPNPNNYPVINHKDSNKTNNNVWNLEWCTVAYNTQYSYDNCDYPSIKRLKITFENGNVIIYPNISYASRELGYKNPTTIQHFIERGTIPSSGKLRGAKLELTEESVTTIERNTSTATSV